MANTQVHSAALRRKAVKLFGLGHSASQISREIGVTGPTVIRWAKAAGVEKGSMAPALISSEDDFELPMESDETSPIVRIMQQQVAERDTKIAMVRTSTPAEQYQTLVAAKGIQMLQAAFNHPPVVKNMRDLKTLTEIVSGALGIDRKGVGGRLAIDLNILTKPAAGQTIEATVVDK